MKYKVLRFYPNIEENAGGMENHIRTLSSLQLKRFSTVCLIYNHGSPVSHWDIKVCENFNLTKLKKSLLIFFLFYSFAILKIIKLRMRATVIHIHGDWSSFLFAGIVKFFSRAEKIVFSFHGSYKTHSYIQLKLLIFFLRKADVVFVNGADSFNYFKLKKLSNVIHQPSGIDDIYFEHRFDFKYHSKDVFRCITVCNLYPVKNMDLILDIARKVSFMEFQILGDGPLMHSLKSRLLEQNISNVFLLGKKTRKQVSEYLSCSSLFLLTSFAEGTPTAVLEAMSFGLPVICSNAGGVDCFIKDNVNGFVIEGFDVDSYVNKINFIYSNQKICRDIYFNNIEFSKQFQWQLIESKISSFFER
jgi:glycosyltransferase involved in cell wall biosynthesis